MNSSVGPMANLPMAELQSMGVRLAAVDAFTTTPMGGNGATVALLPGPAAAGWMLALAAELQQSETAFLWKDGGDWRLRWFTPSCEVKLCGHATLGAALALHHWGELPIGQPLALHSRSGPLRVELTTGTQASLDLPSPGLRARPGAPWMDALLGCPPLGQWHSELGYGVLLLPDDYPLGSLDPGASAWATGPDRAWVLMQAATAPYDYQLRFFGPGLGIREDPVTGSAHALVAPFWCQRLGKAVVAGWQPSHRPGGMSSQPLDSGMIRIIGAGIHLWAGLMPWPPELASAEEWRFTNA